MFVELSLDRFLLVVETDHLELLPLRFFIVEISNGSANSRICWSQDRQELPKFDK